VPNSKRPGAFVYIDGFNLYYGSLDGTPYRWLNVRMLCERLLPTVTVEHIWYFTADLEAMPVDPTKPYRQREYIRALETLPNLTVKKGHFRIRRKWQQLVNPLYPPNPNLPNPSNPRREVWRKEEKGSDVNLATALSMDGAAGRFDEAWVISNDSDLAWPIERVQADYHLPVGVIRPARPSSYPGDGERPDSPHLVRVAHEFRRLKEKHLVPCMFPDGLRDRHGPITKPPPW
jgi:hypothetical protein